MIKDPFVNAPTVGSDDPHVSTGELQKRLCDLELRQSISEALVHAIERQEKSFWGTLWEFASDILKSAPRFLFAIAAVMTAGCKVKETFSKDDESKHHRHK